MTEASLDGLDDETGLRLVGKRCEIIPCRCPVEGGTKWLAYESGPQLRRET
jgi:hypothetical protein